MHPFSLVIAILILLSWARVYRPFRANIEGTVLAVRPLPLLARLRMHAITSTLIVIVSTILIASGGVHWTFAFLPAISIVALMTIPLRYVITDRGIRLGWTEFRRWTEFAGIRRSRVGARLIGNAGGRSFAIWLSGTRGDDEFIQFLRQTQKNAWRGRYAVAPVEPPAAIVDGHNAPMAAFTRHDSM